MTKEEVIDQLESIKRHCESMVDENEVHDIWRADTIALKIAIEIIKKQPSEIS